MVLGGPGVRDAYLARLGLDVEPPSVDALFRLHRAHVERVPYETLWIHLGEPWGIGAEESLDRIAHGRRGGYCYHLNGAFCELLRLLGYHVDRHAGRVHGPDDPAVDAVVNHVALTVHDLPGPGNPRGSWYVDVGLGDGLHEPIPLVAGDYRQGPFRFALEERRDEIGDWELRHDPRGSFRSMTWRTAPVSMDVFEARHRFRSMTADPGVLTVQRRDASGAQLLRGPTVHRLGADTSHEAVTDRDRLVETLTGLFGLDLAGVDDAALDALWARIEETRLQRAAAARR